jgi:hypothetical protein
LLAKTRAMPLPIPLLAPVTMTERPAIEVSMSISSSNAQMGSRARN